MCRAWIPAYAGRLLLPVFGCDTEHCGTLSRSVKWRLRHPEHRPERPRRGPTGRVGRVVGSRAFLLVSPLTGGSRAITRGWSVATGRQPGRGLAVRGRQVGRATGSPGGCADLPRTGRPDRPAQGTVRARASTPQPLTRARDSGYFDPLFLPRAMRIWAMWKWSACSPALARSLGVSPVGSNCARSRQAARMSAVEERLLEGGAHVRRSLILPTGVADRLREAS